MTLVALPGLGLGPEAWRPTLERLSAQAVVRPLPGYGERAAASADLHPRALAEAASRHLPPGERVVVLGHSASCQVAAHLADVARDRVAALVLVGPTTDPRSSTWRRLVLRWLATARHEPPWQVPTLVRQYRRTTLRTMGAAMEVARHDDIAAVLSRVPAPALVVRGHHDRICPADWAAALAGRAGAGSRAVTLAAGGHMVPLTHGELVAQAVAGFLDPTP